MSIEDVLDDGDELTALMRPLYVDLLRVAWADAKAAGLVQGAFDLDNPFVQTVLDQLAMQIRGVADTTREDVRALVGRSADEGWSVDELADALRTKFDDWSVNRSQVIARTEAASAYERGNLAAWRASGQVDRKEWLLGPDPCPLCQPLGGMVVGIDEAFADGVEHPPYHPQCTCAISPVISET